MNILLTTYAYFRGYNWTRRCLSTHIIINDEVIYPEINKTLDPFHFTTLLHVFFENVIKYDNIKQVQIFKPYSSDSYATAVIYFDENVNLMEELSLWFKRLRKKLTFYPLDERSISSTFSSEWLKAFEDKKKIRKFLWRLEKNIIKTLTSDLIANIDIQDIRKLLSDSDFRESFLLEAPPD